MNTNNINTTIYKFFCGELETEDVNRKIVIPDMQREYCWPEKKLVRQFIENLFEESRISLEVKLGMLYGYESPKGFIQLCDGQQRLTTLYLFIGVLYKRISLNEDEALLEKAKNLLISQYELADDQEPRLQYAIRDSTLMYLRDLVVNYFLGKDQSPCNGMDWYFKDYDYDPTVRNMVLAVNEIEQIVSAKLKVDSQSLTKVLKYVLKLPFLYFDMKDRHHGEEQFVVINTTGKALTTAENEKPILLGGITEDGGLQKKYSDMWEKWEKFFWDQWYKQTIRANEKSYVVDAELQEFFRWVFIIEKSLEEKPHTEKEEYTAAQKALQEEPEYNIKNLIENSCESLMDKIDKYFNAMKRLEHSFIGFDSIIKKGNENKLTQKQCMCWLPVLYYVYIFDNQDVNDRDILRVQRFFWSRSEVIDSGSLISHIVWAIRAIDNLHKLKDKDIAKLINAEDINAVILSEQEKWKFDLFLSHIENKQVVCEEETKTVIDDTSRISFENTIWNLENMKCATGDISLALNLMQKAGCYDNPELETLTRIYNLLIETVEIKEIDRNGNPTIGHNRNCLVRRSLLTYLNYRVWSGWTSSLGVGRWAYAENSSFFRSLFRSNDDESKKRQDCVVSYLHDLYMSAELESKMNEMIQSFINIPENKEDIVRYSIVANPEILGIALKGRLSYSDNDTIIYSMSWDSAMQYYSKFDLQEGNKKSENQNN